MSEADEELEEKETPPAELFRLLLLFSTLQPLLDGLAAIFDFFWGDDF